MMVNAEFFIIKMDKFYVEHYWDFSVILNIDFKKAFKYKTKQEALEVVAQLTPFNAQVSTVTITESPNE